MKLYQLLNDNFQEALARLNKQPLPLKTAFELADIKIKIQAQLALYAEVQGKALMKFASKNGEIDINEDSVLIPEENREQYTKEINDVLKTEVDVGVIKRDSLGEDTKISADDVLALSGFIVP